MTSDPNQGTSHPRPDDATEAKRLAMQRLGIEDNQKCHKGSENLHL